MEKYIISLDNLEEVVYQENGEYKAQFMIHKELLSNFYKIPKRERLLINKKYYIILDTIPVLDYVIIKCKEDNE